MPYTLGQAAKAVGRTKATLQEAIKKGRISARKNELGRFEIDPAELHRIYQPVRSSAIRQLLEPDAANPHPAPDLSAEIRRLNDKIELLERLARQIEGERDNLREQNSRLTALLPSPKSAGTVSYFWRQLWRWE